MRALVQLGGHRVHDDLAVVLHHHAVDAGAEADVPTRVAAAAEVLQLRAQTGDLREVLLLGEVAPDAVLREERRLGMRDVAVPGELRRELPAPVGVGLIAEVPREREARLRAVGVVAAREDEGAADLATDAGATGSGPLDGGRVGREGDTGAGRGEGDHGHDARRTKAHVHAGEAPRKAIDRWARCGRRGTLGGPVGGCQGTGAARGTASLALPADGSGWALETAVVLHLEHCTDGAPRDPGRRGSRRAAEPRIPRAPRSGRPSPPRVPGVPPAFPGAAPGTRRPAAAIR